MNLVAGLYPVVDIKQGLPRPVAAHLSFPACFIRCSMRPYDGDKGVGTENWHSFVLSDAMQDNELPEVPGYSVYVFHALHFVIFVLSVRQVADGKIALIVCKRGVVNLDAAVFDRRFHR